MLGWVVSGEASASGTGNAEKTLLSPSSHQRLPHKPTPDYSNFMANTLFSVKVFGCYPSFEVTHKPSNTLG